MKIFRVAQINQKYLILYTLHPVANNIGTKT